MKFTKRLIILSFFIVTVKSLYSQNFSLNSPSDLYKKVTFKYDTKSPNYLVKGLIVEKSDYVYFEVNNGQVDLGNPIKKVFAIGLDNPDLDNYRDFPSYNVGSIICILGNGTFYETRKQFISMWNGIDETIYHAVADKNRMINNSFIPGNYFTAENSGELSFTINDNDKTNNNGTFEITVYVVKKENHLNRNKFNKCPLEVPKQTKTTSSYYDCLDKIWLKEGAKSIYYHGFNNSFRGNTNYPGCQCVYTLFNQELVIKDNDEGSFDIGFWAFGGKDITEARHLHLIVDMLPHDLFKSVYGNKLMYYYYDNAFCNNNTNPTLLLFDVSGSMNENNKWQSAKKSALSTLSSIRSQSKAANLKPSISIRAFEGECIADPTKEVIGFSTDLAAVEDAINTKIPAPDGGTPLPQSIQVSEDKLRTHLTANNIKKGKLIILTDGVSSCGSLRPQGVYGAGQQGYQPPAKFNAAGSAALIRYYAVGFDIAPGSEAERDLQYLVQTNGGKYLNAQNQAELTEALYKFNRVYIPKPAPALTPTSEKDQVLFTDGLTFIEDEEYDKALENYRTYIKTNDKDYNGIYNFALMSEANERYKAAIKNYELYLQLNPNAADKSFVLETILKLKETAKRYAAYNKMVVKSDMEYLNLYFQKIQDGESVALAIEFVGFLKEKYTYYRDLAAIVEVDDRLFKTNANEVFKGLKECVETISRNPQAWDRDATPVLSRTYLNMERLLNSF